MEEKHTDSGSPGGENGKPRSNTDADKERQKPPRIVANPLTQGELREADEGKGQAARPLF